MTLKLAEMFIRDTKVSRGCALWLKELRYSVTLVTLKYKYLLNAHTRMHARTQYYYLSVIVSQITLTTLFFSNYGVTLV